MLWKSVEKIILYKYIWSFWVYIYTHAPDAGFSLNCHKEKLHKFWHAHFLKNIYIYLFITHEDKQNIKKLKEFEDWYNMG